MFLRLKYEKIAREFELIEEAYKENPAFFIVLLMGLITMFMGLLYLAVENQNKTKTNEVFLYQVDNIKIYRITP